MNSTPTPTRTLCSIHSWVGDDRHDLVLQHHVPHWRVVSVHRPALTFSGRAPRDPRVWIDNAVNGVLEAAAEGPIALLGWSMGGKVAAAVASELRARGRDVDFLGVIDGYGEWPSLMPSRWPSLAASWRGARGPSQKWLVLRRGPLSRMRWRVAWLLSRAVPRVTSPRLRAKSPNGELSRYYDEWITAIYFAGSRLRYSPTDVALTLFRTGGFEDVLRQPRPQLGHRRLARRTGDTRARRAPHLCRGPSRRGHDGSGR
jgi:pimeloyl-ACP methyl ester carboxylesterase